MNRIFLLESIIEKLNCTLPAIFARKEVPKLLGNCITTGTLANLQSSGLGPPSLRNGRNSVYEKETFLVWLKIYLGGGIKALKKIKNE